MMVEKLIMEALVYDRNFMVGYCFKEMQPDHYSSSNTGVAKQCLDYFVECSTFRDLQTMLVSFMLEPCDNIADGVSNDIFSDETVDARDLDVTQGGMKPLTYLLGKVESKYDLASFRYKGNSLLHVAALEADPTSWRAKEKAVTIRILLSFSAFHSRLQNEEQKTAFDLWNAKYGVLKENASDSDKERHKWIKTMLQPAIYRNLNL